MGLCEAIALTTTRIRFGTAIANMYTRHVFDYAQSAAFIHEISGGRFHFGVGVSHGPMNDRLGLATGKPLADARRFAEQYKAAPRVGELAPLVLAGLRKKMVALAGELAEGVVFANTTRSTLPDALGALPAAKRADPRFFVGNMIPTCISDDRAAAASVNRKTFIMYLQLPNYRNAWRDAGYASEIAAVEQARGRRARREARRADGRALAEGRLALRQREGGARGLRGVARRRPAHADPRAVVGEGQPARGVRGAVRRVRLSAADAA